MDKLDQYGFVKVYDTQHEQFFLTNVLPNLKNRDDRWFEYVKKVGGTFQVDIDDKDFKKMVRMGIPDEMRPMIWAKITGIFDRIKNNPDLYSQTCDAFSSIPQQVDNIIGLDIPRTFPGSNLNYEILSKILHALAVIHPEIGYCQGMNFIAAICLAVMRDEEQSFFLLLKIIEDYLPPDYFTPSMTGYQTDLTMMAILLKERIPDVYNYAKDSHFLWIEATSNWIVTLFTNTLPMTTVLRIWDSFLLEGQKVIFRAALAVVKMHSDILLNTPGNKISVTFKALERNLVDQNQLMEIAFNFKAFSRNHLMDLRLKAHRIVVEHGIPDEANIQSGFHSFLGHMNL